MTMSLEDLVAHLRDASTEHGKIAAGDETSFSRGISAGYRDAFDLCAGWITEALEAMKSEQASA